MSGALSKAKSASPATTTPEVRATTIKHRYGGSAPGVTPHLDGYIAMVTLELEELPKDHPSKLGYELRIMHPELTPVGHKQAPEVFRYADEKSATAHAEHLAKMLDNVEPEPDDEG